MDEQTKQKATLLTGGILGGLLLGANAGKIVKGVTVGLIAIVAAFFLIWQSVNGVDEVSVKLAAINLQSVSDAKGQRGLVKVYGGLDTQDPISLRVISCGEPTCDPRSLRTEIDEEELLYFSVENQRFEVIRKVEESKEGARGTTETVTYEHKWVTKSEETKWTDVTMSGLDIDLEDSRRIIDTEGGTVAGVYIPNLPAVDTYGRTPAEDEPAFGSTRAIVSYIPRDDREYIVVGEMRSSGITSGDPFIVTDKSDQELTNQLGGEESSSRTFMRILAFVLLTFGFTSMLTPILVFTDLIPIAGQVARGVATLISGIISGIIVIATVLLLNFWWMILLGAVIGVLGFGFISLKANKKIE